MNTCSNRRRTREVKAASQIAITLCWRRNLQSQATANTSKSFYSLYSLFLSVSRRPRSFVLSSLSSFCQSSSFQGSENIDDNNNKLITLSIYPFIHHLSFLLLIKRNRCQSCMYQYSPKKGDDFYPVSAGTPFKDLPEDWNCPVCGASKSKFKSIGRQVAGFEQNQGYGFGTNSMTEGEKSKLIYGGLALFFVFFLAGYLLE